MFIVMLSNYCLFMMHDDCIRVLYHEGEPILLCSNKVQSSPDVASRSSNVLSGVPPFWSRSAGGSASVGGGGGSNGFILILMGFGAIRMTHSSPFSSISGSKHILNLVVGVIA